LPAAFANFPAPPAKVVRYAMTMMQRYDTNGDGILQREEWEKMPGTPQAIDLDGDQQITLDELIRYLTRYGQGRTIHRNVPIDLSEPYRFDPANLQVFRPVLPRADVPSFSSAGAHEASDNAMEELMQANEQPIDDEIYQRLLIERQIPAERPYHVLPENLRGVPVWFIMLDRNGDGQVSLAEFAPTLAPAAVELFKRLDKNGNGFIEPDEVRSP
jgi:Ca2+-binding EF-hand superfamily protein